MCFQIIELLTFDLFIKKITFEKLTTSTQGKNIQVELSLKLGPRLHSLTLNKIIIAIQIPYLHYFKAKRLFGSFLVYSVFPVILNKRYLLLEVDTSDY
jgi:hypothetical protein